MDITFKNACYVFFGIAFSACSNGTSSSLYEEVTDDAINICVNTNGILTRSVSPYTSSTAKITLYGGSVNSVHNAEYMYNATSGRWESDYPLAWYGLTKRNGVFPFFAVAPQALGDADEGEILHNQKTAANFESSDLLMAYRTTPEKVFDLSLTLQHLLAQLRIVFTPGETEITPTVLKSVKCVLSGVQPSYQITYPALPTESVPAVAKGIGVTVSDIESYSQIDSTYTRIHNTILPPQQIAKSLLSVTITAEVGGETRSMVWTNSSSVKLLAGCCTVIKLKMFTQEELVLGDISVNPWDETDVDGDFGY